MQKPKVPRNLRKNTSWHKTSWIGAETQRAHDYTFEKRKVKKEHRTCPRCRSVLKLGSILGGRTVYVVWKKSKSKSGIKTHG